MENMRTSLDAKLIEGYRSNSQIARVLTETWTEMHMYCPVCGWPTISKFPNNKKVADFYCPSCKSEFEQKSKKGEFGAKIADGAYKTFIQRISSNNNPDFLIMSYSLERLRVESLYFIPKYFFVPEVVEKRKPLAEGAKRAGWVGCNILFDKIPAQGRIPIIKNGTFMCKDRVLDQVKRAQKIKIDDIAARGWLFDVLRCIDRIESDIFTLSMVYAFEKELSIKYPKNNNIRAKIRQQLQQLKNRGVISFLGNGYYQKINKNN